MVIFPRPALAWSRPMAREATLALFKTPRASASASADAGCCCCCCCCCAAPGAAATGDDGSGATRVVWAGIVGLVGICAAAGCALLPLRLAGEALLEDAPRLGGSEPCTRGSAWWPMMPGTTALAELGRATGWTMPPLYAPPPRLLGVGGALAGWWAQQTAPDCIGGEKAGTGGAAGGRWKVGDPPPPCCTMSWGCGCSGCGCST
mmetsp:Transcript_27802/g.91417  ORF Transcript_27802/g.91417 Transcript_27802/m.91417 type:complete len:205 (+) Transcript_27802:751-1365(+)